jgi:hypothetical protein
VGGIDEHFLSHKFFPNANGRADPGGLARLWRCIAEANEYADVAAAAAIGPPVSRCSAVARFIAVLPVRLSAPLI